jgi:hypothetical protein
LAITISVPAESADPVHPARTFVMSSTARTAPYGVPVTLERPDRGQVVDVHLGDAPPCVRGPDDGLQRVAGAPVHQAQGEERLPAGRAQRSQVVQRHPRPPPDPTGEFRVRDAQVPGPGVARGRPPTAEHQVGLVSLDRSGDPGQLLRIQRGVGVGEGDDRCRGSFQARVAGRAVPPSRTRHDEGTEPAG